jgi:hypothetical protein
MVTTIVVDNDGDDNDVYGDCATSNEVDDDGDGTTGWVAAGRDMTRTTMAMSDDDNDVNGNGATSNKVDDDGDGATGDDNNNDDDDGNGNGDGATDSGAT